jgi:flavodoxin I
MKKAAIFYGSSLGNTQFVAEKIHAHLPEADCISVSEATPYHIKQYQWLILGTSTWGIGNLQDDFEPFVELLINQDLKGKTIALFGLGDQHTYPDTFCNGMGKLYELLQDKGAQFIGAWPANDYDFSESSALREDGQLVGLALDEDNEPDLSDSRVEKWVQQLKSELLIND